MATSNSVRSASSTEGGGSFSCNVGSSFWILRNLRGQRGDARLCHRRHRHQAGDPHFLAMLSILSFFFMRGREVLEMVVSTSEEVDWETWGRGRGVTSSCGDIGERHPVVPRGRCHPWCHLAHDLAPVEQHLVPLPEAVFGRLLCGHLWKAGRRQRCHRMCHPLCHPIFHRGNQGVSVSPPRCHSLLRRSRRTSSTTPIAKRMVKRLRLSIAHSTWGGR